MPGCGRVACLTSGVAWAHEALLRLWRFWSHQHNHIVMANGMNWRDDGSKRELQIISSGHMLVQHFQQTVRFFHLACLFSTLRFFSTQVGMTRQDHNNTTFLWKIIQINALFGFAYFGPLISAGTRTSQPEQSKRRTADQPQQLKQTE